MVKNIVILVLLGLLILILFGLNQEFEWIHFEWKPIAIAISALAAPFHYLKNWIDEKQISKVDKQTPQYRVLDRSAFEAREQGKVLPKENIPSKSSSFDVEGAMG